ncbi:MAG: type I secretion C-terminal target domain-containing protein [Xanthobacteraceae bacterium]
MALLSGFNVSINEVKLFSEASRAAFDGGSIPSGWSVVTPGDLGLAAEYHDGNYFRGGSSGASAIVLKNGNEYIVSFRGTDGANDVSRYLELYTGKYIDHFKPLLDALAAQAPGDATFSFTGASLGGGATNLMAKIAASAYDGRFADAKFVAFASPNITNANGILNIGFENDPVYKAVGLHKDFASSLDNLVLATAEYMAGNTTGRQPFNMYAHSASLGFEAVNRLAESQFYDLMKPDSVIIFDAADDLVQDRMSGRTKTGAFYLGESVADQITGRDGNDYIEGFGGNDILKGGKGNDSIRGGDGADLVQGEAGDDMLYGDADDDTLAGGAGKDKSYGGPGDDTFVVSGTDAENDTFAGDNGVDRILVTGSVVLTLAGFNAAASSIEVWNGNGVAIAGTKNANVFDFSGLNAVTDVPYIDGGKGNDTIIGSNFADELRGGANNDTLNGGGGDDRLVGGAANDMLTGGEGADTFLFSESGTKNKDTILDYDFGENDVIDLAALLDAKFGPSSVVNDFVRLTVSGLDILVQIDANGATSGAKFVDVAVLSGYSTAGVDQVLVQFEQQAQVLAA